MKKPPRHVTMANREIRPARTGGRRRSSHDKKRCCKRDSFTAAKEAAGFVKEELGVEMELNAPIKCDFSPENRQCIRAACPYYKG